MNQFINTTQGANILAVLNGLVSEFNAEIKYEQGSVMRTATLQVTNNGRPMALLIGEDMSAAGTSINTDAPINELTNWVIRKLATRAWYFTASVEAVAEPHKLAV